jgi:hypothetical protein
MRKAFFTLAVLGLVAAPALALPETVPPAGAPAPGATALDGTRWQVKLTPDEAAAKLGEKPFETTVSFAKGKVESSECVKVGFAASPYKMAAMDEKWTFETTQTSEKNGSTQWKGTVTGDTVKGTMTWTKADGTLVHYTFEGKKAATPTM